ncbi:MAG TPA: hypothetical protein VNI54_12925 [Thermoanaerobaculia bacterium]|nr:hypothetical protein [Thermoanaerobaculia bacterium]
MKRLILMLSVIVGSTGAAWPLNPLVTRNAQASGPVSSECEEGLAPAPTPRIDVAEIPAPEIAPASVAAPPSRTLRRTLEDAHAALARNDRPAFDESLATARALLRDYPPGGERTAAEESLRVYEDAALLWDAQFESPFFGETSEAYTRASRYPGYAEAVRRGLLTDDADRRFYPAAESRDFLTRVAAQRLERLGVRATTRLARAERPSSTVTERPSSTVTERRTTTSRPTVDRPTTSRTPSARRSPPVRRASATNIPPSRPRKSATPAMSAPASPDPPASAKVVTESAPATPPAAAPTPAAPAPSPVAGSPAPDPAPVDPAPVDPATTSSPAVVPAPDTAPPPATQPAEKRSYIVPALLIAIGLGVLFVLFRVSK